jgi:replicative DNA helicase
MTNNIITTTATDIQQENNVQKQFDFDRPFQERIIQAMLMDKTWATQFTEVLNINYFQYAHLKLIANKYVGYYRKYREFPSMELLLSVLKEELKENVNPALKEDVRSILIRVEAKKDMGDIAFVKEKSLEFCKKAALQNALLKSVDLVATQNYDQIVNVMRDALAAGNEESKGLDLFEDIDIRYSETYRNPIPTGIEELDQKKILNGGLGAGELGLVVAGSGQGKTHLLIQFGASALKAGKNVLHYTLELNERVVGIRYDSHLTDIPSLDCHEHQDEIKTFFKEHEKTIGRLVVKFFATGQASCETIRAHMDKLKNRGFVPDLILVDYAGIMKSVDGESELLRIKLKQICEDLRYLAVDLNLPVWSASQSNREGSTAEVVDMTNMAESYAQAHVADVIFGFSRPSTQKITGFGTLFIAKNRAGLDGIKFNIHLDTSRSKLKILTDEEAGRFKEEIASNDRLQLLEKFNKLTSAGVTANGGQK